MGYLDSGTPNFSPLREHSSARFVRTSTEVIELLNNKQWLTTPSGLKISDFFWLDEKLPKWHKLINNSFDDVVL